MYVVKGLFDFSGGDIGYEDEPTRVVAEVRVEGENEASSPEIVEKATSVYMTSEQGFDNYCRECCNLLMVQETGSNFVPIRVFCKVVKCVK